MAIGSSLMNQKGKVRLNEPMTTYIHQGRVVVRSYPKNAPNPRTSKQVKLRKVLGTLVKMWYSNLTKYERDGWNAFAGSLYSAYLKGKHDCSNSGYKVINQRALYPTGFNAFVGLNMTAYAFDMTLPRLKPPFGYGFPTPPSELSVDYDEKEKVIVLHFQDPNVEYVHSDGGILKPSDAKVRIAVTAQYKSKTYRFQVQGVLDIPAKGEFIIKGFQGFRQDDFRFLKFSELEKTATIWIQMDTAVAWKPDLAPLRSVGSEMVEVVLQKPIDISFLTK